MTLFASGLPEVQMTRGNWPVATEWLTPADIPDTVEGLFEELLVARAPRWLPVSVLDTAEHWPEPEPEQGELRRLWPEQPWWHAQALCAVADPKQAIDPWWFGIDNEDRPALPEVNVRKARAVCEVCPVAAQCLEWALVNDERFGIWGGTTGRQRTLMRGALRAGQVTVGELLAAYG